MPRAFGTTNAAPYASAPAVGAAGDTYWNTVDQSLYVSDGTSWDKIGPGVGGPPSGSASGDLTGVYPGPTVLKTSTAHFTVGSNTDCSVQLAPTAGYVKARVAAFPGYPSTMLSHNIMWNGSAWVRDDTAKVAWRQILWGSADRIDWIRTDAAGVDTTLLQLDALGRITLGAPTVTAKLRLGDVGTGDFQLRANITMGAVQDDATKPSWVVRLGPSLDDFAVFRSPAGSAALTRVFQVNASADTVLGRHLFITGAAWNGAGTIRGTWDCGTDGTVFLHTNNSYGPADATKPSWFVYESPVSDNFAVYRRAANAGAGAHTALLNLDNIGSMTLTGNLFTPGGTHLGKGIRCSQGGGGIAGDGYSNQIGIGWSGSQITARVDNVAPGYYITVTSASDERLKTAIQDDVPGLAAVCAMRPITFEYVPGYFPPAAGTETTVVRRHYGMIAQEVQPWAPLAIIEDDSEDHYLALDYQTLVPVLVKAVKELAARVEALEA